MLLCSLVFFYEVVMRKVIGMLMILNIGSVFAQGEIVYLVPESVLANSKVLTAKFQQQKKQFHQQEQPLMLQINQIQQEVSKTGQPQASLEQLSLKLYTLQNQIESLNKQNATYYNKAQNDYMPYVRKASNQLYAEHKYQYILTSSAIVVTDPKNDISVEVSNLADKLYQADQH